MTGFQGHFLFVQPVRRTDHFQRHRSLQAFLPDAVNQALSGGKWRYLPCREGEEEGYHIEDDPHEWRNLAGFATHRGTLRSMRESLESKLSTIAE